MDSVLSAHFKNILLFLTAIYLLLPSVHSTPVKYCDKKGNYVVKVRGVEISPNPVVKGRPATFNVSASTGQVISGGNLVIDVSYYSLHVHTETRDFCGGASCPIAVGSFMLSHTESLPIYTPPGPYTLKMTLKDTSNELLTCISFNFKIGFGSMVSDN